MERSLQCFNKALEIDPSYTSPLINKAGALSMLGRLSESMECCEKAIKIAPNEPHVWNNAVFTLYTMGKFDETIECYRKAIQLKFPKFALAYSNTGQALIEFGKYKDAIKYCNKCIEINPNFSSALVYKGNALRYFVVKTTF